MLDPYTLNAFLYFKEGNYMKEIWKDIEGYVERMIAPPKTEDTKNCKYCPYKGICSKIS